MGTGVGAAGSSDGVGTDYQKTGGTTGDRREGAACPSGRQRFLILKIAQPQISPKFFFALTQKTYPFLPTLPQRHFRICKTFPDPRSQVALTQLPCTPRS